MLSNTVAPQRICVKITECDVNNDCNYQARGNSGHWKPNLNVVSHVTPFAERGKVRVAKGGVHETSLSAYCHGVKFQQPTGVGKISAKW